MERSPWLKELEDIFQQEKFSGLNSRYYQPQKFLLLARRVKEFQTDCRECASLTRAMTEVCRQLNRETPVTDSLKMQYSRLFRSISSHLRKTHHLQTPGIYTSLYTLAGMIAGIAAWYFVKVIFGAGIILINPKTDFLLAAFVGLVVGRIAGKKKDKKAHLSNHTLF